MIRTSFDSGWVARRRTSPFAAVAGQAPAWEPVTLPHDALIGAARSADSAQGVNAGFFPGGAFEYEKTFEVPPDWRDRRVSLRFDGVYRDAMVYVNRDFAGQHAYGYSAFSVDLDPFLRYGAAIVVVATTVRNASHCTVTADLRTTLTAPDSGRDAPTLADEQVPVTVHAGDTAVVRQRFRVEAPARWSPDTPHLYAAGTALSLDGALLEESVTRFGIRSLQLDAVDGLRVNGEPVKLRGACIHHDNGVLGSVALPRAERRRAELLKAAGFNAVRSAHHPMSTALLDACDEVGLLVMDEAFDVWTESKTDHDYGTSFPQWWRRDLAAMVAKDRNHPSVILYSIGNEPFEAGSPHGAVWGRRLTEELRSLDPTRYVTNGINAAIAVLPHTREAVAEIAPGTSEQDVNTLLGSGPEIFNAISASDLASRLVEESFSVLDVVGLNYGDARYPLDAKSHPHRVLVGSETFPTAIARNWPVVERSAHVIGDFTWTGWDYLGESGIGRTHYPDEAGGVQGRFPWLTAWCGDLDITGHRRPASYLREIVFGLRTTPYVAVRRPQRYGQPTAPNAWGWTDGVATWTWDVPVGSPVQVEVYSADDEVELLVDGRPVGRAPVGAAHGFTAVFDTAYRPGELVAVAYRNGSETGRTTLRTADDDVRLVLDPDRTRLAADPTDAAFVGLELRDSRGVLHTTADRTVRLTVTGPGVLAGLESADPRTTEPFTADRCTTYEGRALAVVRPTGAPGVITIRATAEALGSASIEVVTS